MESFPPITWTESGQTPALGESSSSRLWDVILPNHRQEYQSTTFTESALS
jgi:hypothetical protein